MLKFNDFLKEAKKCTDEELVGKQHKLDVNKNGKLDSDDFKKLRATKEEKHCKEDEVDENYVSHAQRKAVWASKNEKGVKEETEYTIEDFSLEELEDFMMSEEFEQLDEISKKVLGSYVKKASADIAKREVRIDRAMDASGSNYNEPSMQKALNKNVKRVAGLNKAADKLAKEEVELDEAMTPMQKLKDALDRHSEKAVAANKAGDHEAVKVHLGYVNRIKTKMGKLAKNEEIDLNEMESLCEISKKTLASYVSKASHSAANKMYSAGYTDHMSHAERNKGNDALAQAHSRHAGKSYSKSVTRLQGIGRASAKLAKEEKLDELSKKTLQSYQSKIGHDLDRAMDAMPHGTGDDKEDRKLNNRMVGDERAQKRLMKMNKEEAEMDYLSPTLSFLDSLGEGKIDDLKDRMRMKQATQSAFDKDYKPAEKKHANITVHKGTSYGGQENDNDEDEKNEKPEAKEKRGRGRPAGSKSGARL